MKKKTPKSPPHSKDKQLAAAGRNTSLFGCLYINNQLRDGDPDGFFSHENQIYPPSLSEYGNLHKGAKSDLVKCLDITKEGLTTEDFD